MMAGHFDENETMNLCPFLKKLSATSWLRATDSLRGRLSIIIEVVENGSNYVSYEYLSKYLRDLIQNNSKDRRPQKEERWDY